MSNMVFYRVISKQVTTLTSAVIFCLVLATGPAQAERKGIEGLWFDNSGRGAVRITRCGRNLCGNIEWLKKPLKPNGRPFTDELNPKRSQRKRRICGLKVIGRLARQSDGSWDKGWIYDPKVGKAYDVAVSLASPNRLRVVGYLGIKLMGRTLIWKRAPDDLEPCDPNA